jgi:hypothetical protein
MIWKTKCEQKTRKRIVWTKTGANKCQENSLNKKVMYLCVDDVYMVLTMFFIYFPKKHRDFDNANVSYKNLGMLKKHTQQKLKVRKLSQTNNGNNKERKHVRQQICKQQQQKHQVQMSDNNECDKQVRKHVCYICVVYVLEIFVYVCTFCCIFVYIRQPWINYKKVRGEGAEFNVWEHPKDMRPPPFLHFLRAT